jgi:hypothetical protein
VGGVAECKHRVLGKINWRKDRLQPKRLFIRGSLIIGIYYGRMFHKSLSSLQGCIKPLLAS